MFDTDESVEVAVGDLDTRNRVRAQWGEDYPDSASPVVFFRYGDRYRVYQFDAYLLAGLLHIEPEIVHVEKVDERIEFRMVALEIHELFMKDVLVTVVAVGRSYAFFHGEVPGRGILGDMEDDMEHQTIQEDPPRA
jgi:hypothetical protein